ncbi:tRNA (guanine(37)-N1)-methyltransferase [Cyphellophora attinorum]|uniref:tRNA (guanine(37)-N1)-methyltransferase n=1 Tax=Cyphellophora attinorum TaxID=1664694 RepID=A0A0N1GYY6_9EURO|nr:tRNA (guanine(37)-N1)-methyltransferase [Phialophora attinorum]KPI36164.1 tRNA (guanine(37)-N1)-methyltransferase [Phialophora attinorum]
MDTSILPSIFWPTKNQSMRDLDRPFFNKSITLAAATVTDPKQIAGVRKALSKDVLVFSKPIRDSPHIAGAKCVLLHSRIVTADSTTWPAALKSLNEEGVVHVHNYDLKLGYEDYSMQSILDAILPSMPEDEQETPAGFAQVGHVAHLNLRRQYLPYKHLIGQVLLDKNPQIRTVINKLLDVGTESAFRTFPYEVLAGDDDLDVTVSESQCTFCFNFGKVYWNSRLGTEHARIVDKFSEGEAVCDLMAGVGPFAVPAGKRRVFVYANDLNPDSFAGLQDAITRNKVGDFVQGFCDDARTFVHSSAKRLQRDFRVATIPPKTKISRTMSREQQAEAEAKIIAETIILRQPTSFDHYVMNLPASAVEFLNAFKGLLHGREDEFYPYTEKQLPWIHVHLFQAKCPTTEEEHAGVLATVSKHLGHELKPAYDNGEIELFDVRLVAPNKRMYCASFRLPAEIAFPSPKTVTTQSVQP